MLTTLTTQRARARADVVRVATLLIARGGVSGGPATAVANKLAVAQLKSKRAAQLGAASRVR